MDKTHYSLENFCGASGPCHYVLLYTANDSKGKLLRLAEKSLKFYPLESFAVYGSARPTKDSIVNTLTMKSSETNQNQGRGQISG